MVFIWQSTIYSGKSPVAWPISKFGSHCNGKENELPIRATARAVLNSYFIVIT